VGAGKEKLRTAFCHIWRVDPVVTMLQDSFILVKYFYILVQATCNIGPIYILLETILYWFNIGYILVQTTCNIGLIYTCQYLFPILDRPTVDIGPIYTNIGPIHTANIGPTLSGVTLQCWPDITTNIGPTLVTNVGPIFLCY